MSRFSEVCLQPGDAPQRAGTEPQGLSRVGLMLHRVRTRKVLLTLTDRQLRDVGLSREQALEEAGKPFWRR